MEIRLRPEQIKPLLELVYLGAWVAGVMVERTDDSRELEKLKEFEDIEQRIYSTAQAAGSVLVEHDQSLSMHFLTAEFEESILRYVDEYDDHTFWEELMERLSQRDLEQEHGAALERMAREERARLFDQKLEGYYREFEANGLERLRVTASSPPSPR